MNGRLCSANLNSEKETFVATFMALSQHLPRWTEELMKILMQYVNCTSHELTQTNVTARATLFGGVSWVGNIYTYIYLHNFTTAIKWHIFNTFHGMNPKINSANSLLQETFITCAYHKLADTTEKIRQTKEDITYKHNTKQYLETIF
jgi:hypothetical protein